MSEKDDSNNNKVDDVNDVLFEQNLRRRKLSNDSFHELSNFLSTSPPPSQNVETQNYRKICPKKTSKIDVRKCSTRSAPFGPAAPLSLYGISSNFSATKQRSLSNVDQILDSNFKTSTSSAKTTKRERKRGRASVNSFNNSRSVPFFGEYIFKVGNEDRISCQNCKDLFRFVKTSPDAKHSPQNNLKYHEIKHFLCKHS